MLCTSSQLNSIPQGLFTVNTFASIKPRGVRDTWLGWSKCIDLVCCGCFGSAPGCVDRHSVTPGVTATSAPRFLFHIQPYTPVISTLILRDIWPSVPLWLNQYPNEQVSAWYWHTVSGNVEQSRECDQEQMKQLCFAFLLWEAWVFKHNYIQLEALYLQSWKDITTARPIC